MGRRIAGLLKLPALSLRVQAYRSSERALREQRGFSDDGVTPLRYRAEGSVQARLRPDARRDERFVVTRQLPETGGVFQYHVKSEIDGHNRLAREDQLADL